MYFDVLNNLGSKWMPVLKKKTQQGLVLTSNTTQHILFSSNIELGLDSRWPLTGARNQIDVGWQRWSPGVPVVRGGLTRWRSPDGERDSK